MLADVCEMLVEVLANVVRTPGKDAERVMRLDSRDGRGVAIGLEKIQPRL